MTIQTKTLSIILATFLCLSAILSLILQNIIMQSYLQLEKTDVHAHLQRTLNIINLEKDNLQRFTSDWAVWDDSYQFINKQNKEYIDSNLVDTTYSDNNLAFILYINNAKKIIYGNAYDFQQEQQIPLFNSLKLYLENSNKLKPSYISKNSISGLISLPEGVFFIASVPILTSNGTGPSPGALLMGKRLNSDFILQLSDIVKLDVAIYPDINLLPAELTYITKSMSIKNKYHISIVNDNYLSAYTYINDINNNPISLLKLNIERGIFQQAQFTNNLLFITIVIVTLILALVFIMLMRSLVLKRIINLSQEVNEIQSNTLMDKRITGTHPDEIGKLSTNINKMISTIQTNHNKLEHAKFKAEKANAAKTEFLSRLSHELRTPLNAILGFAQLLELKYSDSTSNGDKDHVHEILVAGKYLLHLINELLDLAKIEEGKYNIALTKVSAGDLLNSCITMLNPIAIDKNILINHSCSENHNYHVLADPGALKQVFINIINNAIKYNVKNGQVTINCSFINNNKVIINISDTGNGIPATEIENIFEPFTRLETTSTTEGTGIGLAVTKKLLNLMHGEIGVESEPGKGSRFWIILPSASPVD